MTKWEHMCINLNAGSTFPEDWLEEMDKLGGELVAVDNGIAYYRIPKQHPIPVRVGPAETKGVSDGPGF